MLKILLKTCLISCLVLLTPTIIQAALPFESDNNTYFNTDEETLISMDFQNARLTTVLKVFSQQSGLNFIATDAVANRKVNLYLNNVPIEEALERILTASQLTYEINPGSNIFLVKALKKNNEELITRIYPLKYATVSTSKLFKTLSTEEQQQTSSDDEKKDEGLNTSIIDVIKGILTADGSVFEDSRTNSIIVTDIASQFAAIGKMIARLDVRIPQILIEVEMLDISSNTAALMGIKFGDTPITFRGAERDSVAPFHFEDDGFTFEESQYRVSTLSFQGLTLALQFLRTQSDTKNLARPRILTLNNETAEIQIKTNEAIAQIQSTASSEGTAETVTEPERVETGVFLKVTPQANVLSGEIKMAIEPKVIQARPGIIINGSTVFDPEERGTKSILRIQDGDTIVIGGLIRTDATHVKTKVPILSNIPILGSAFRHKDDSEKKRELVIFITPNIIKDDLNNAPLFPKRQSKPFMREQTMPTIREQEIQSALLSAERQQRF